ncbi:hypothetical protein AHAS_Ahas15G0185500 [Arachis hypogaea]
MTDSNEPKERSMLASLLPVLASHSRRFVLASSRLICSSLCVLLCSPPSVALNFYLNRCVRAAHSAERQCHALIVFMVLLGMNQGSKEGSMQVEKIMKSQRVELGHGRARTRRLRAPCKVAHGRD